MNVKKIQQRLTSLPTPAGSYVNYPHLQVGVKDETYNIVWRLICAFTSWLLRGDNKMTNNHPDHSLNYSDTKY